MISGRYGYRPKLPSIVGAEGVVPVRAVKRVALVKVLHERHILKVEGIGFVFLPVHRGAHVLLVDHERAANRGLVFFRIAHAAAAGADQGGVDRTRAHVSHE